MSDLITRMKKAREIVDYISRDKALEKDYFSPFFWSFLQNWLRTVMIVWCLVTVWCLSAGGVAKFYMKKMHNFNS